MSRVAVFVDAGYFFAQGSTALTGAKQEQRHAILDRERLLTELRSLAFQKTGHQNLLRIYWYDGVPRGGPTAQQQNMAEADDVKLRLGLINEYGQQKGVDSLVVTDLIELSSNRAISDAVMLSGDEDVRIGVEIAQSLGVRVHLLGIAPARGSQARTLLSAADTKTEWNKETIEGFLTVAPSGVPGDTAEPTLPDSGSDEPDVEPTFGQVVVEVAEAYTDDDLAACRDALRQSSQVPQPYDGRLLAICRTHLGRDLTGPERSRLRQAFRAHVEGATAERPVARPDSSSDGQVSEDQVQAALEAHVEDSVCKLTEAQKRELREFWQHAAGVPPDFDRPLLASCREKIGRDLTPEERRILRRRFQEEIEKPESNV